MSDITCCAFAQGIAAVAPMSKSAGPGDSSISFLVQNLTANEIQLSYQPECDVGGLEVKGEECLKAFDVNFLPPPVEGVFTVPQSGRVEGSVSLKNTNIEFALFKPIFEPANNPSAKKPEGVAFEFGYQPGYLFIVKPKAQELAPPRFSTIVQGSNRRVRFSYMLDTLTMPALLNISAKIINKSDKKLIRFLSLAREKIADPKRAILELESDFTLASNKDPVCFQIFVDDRFAKKTNTAEGCER